MRTADRRGNPGNLQALIRPIRGRSDAGFTIIGLLVTVAVVNIALGIATTSWLTMSARAKEAELIWRGLQYERALACHQRETGGLPDELDELLDSNCIRALYPDPMSPDGQWRILRQSDLAELGALQAGAAGAAAGTGRARSTDELRLEGMILELRGPEAFLEGGRGPGGRGAGGRGISGTRPSVQLRSPEPGRLTLFGPAGQQQGPSRGGLQTDRLQQTLQRYQSLNRAMRARLGVAGNSIVGVVSRSEKEGLGAYEGESLYSEWRFVVGSVGG